MPESAAGCAVLRITHRVGVTEERGGCEGVRRVVRSTPPGRIIRGRNKTVSGGADFGKDKSVADTQRCGAVARNNPFDWTPQRTVDLAWR